MQLLILTWGYAQMNSLSHCLYRLTMFLEWCINPAIRIIQASFIRYIVKQLRFWGWTPQMYSNRQVRRVFYFPDLCLKLSQPLRILEALRRLRVIVQKTKVGMYRRTGTDNTRACLTSFLNNFLRLENAPGPFEFIEWLSPFPLDPSNVLFYRCQIRIKRERWDLSSAYSLTSPLSSEWRSWWAPAWTVLSASSAPLWRKVSAIRARSCPALWKTNAIGTARHQWRSRILEQSDLSA